MSQLKKICILIAGILLVSCCFATDIYAQTAEGETQAAEGETQECYTHEFYQKKYTSGCWSCLVLEKLTSAFLKVASAAMPICEKAGHILLIWGFVIWMCFWALKNVASFTEIKGGNILNEFLQMAGRVVIAYVCITMGTTAIRQFIITPIMGVGATIAQNFWSKNKSISNYNKALDEYMTDFDWDFTVEDVKELDKENKEFMERTSAGVTQSANSGQTETGLTADQIAENEEISKENDANFAKTHIPNLLIPGVKDGSLSSPAGPRSCSNCSKCHKGVDIGPGCGSTNSPRAECVYGCIPYYAAGPGILAYARPNGKGNGAGFSASINHGKIKGHTWQTNYFHMRPGSSEQFGFYPNRTYQVKQGEKIGCLGQSGGSKYPGEKLYPIHGHFEVLYDGQHVDPMMLPNGHIVKIKPICDCGFRNNEKSKCPASGNGTYTIYRDGMAVGSGWPAAGEGIIDLNTLEGSGAFLGAGPESLIVEIPDVKYTGPTDIMPKSIADSLIGATKAITDTTAQFMVLGNMVMCFSNMKDGGAWDLKLFTMTNIFMWLDAAILWVLGFILTCVVAYYLIDMSFKIGFAVMALPIVMGLWPFKITQDKLASTIAIIAKSSALFAFLALATYYGLELVVASFGGAEGLGGIFNDFDKVVSGSVSAEEKEKIVETLEDNFYIFSTKFLMMLFGAIYTYKIISKTTKELVDKFYPDNVFGGENPMHKMMTGMASMANNLNKKYGTGLVGDIASNAAGKAVKGAASKAVSGTKAVGRATGGAIRGASKK